MLTIKPEILPNKQRQDGTYNVKIRFTYKRQVKRVSTSLFACPSDIAKKSMTLKENSLVRRKTDALVAKYKDICASMQLELHDYSLDDILRLIENHKRQHEKIDFIKFSKGWIAKTTIKGKKNYTTAINSFTAFLGKDILDIKDLTSRLLQAFLKYLQGDSAKPNRKQSLYLGSLRHLFKEAQREYNDYDQNIIPIPHSPFDNFKVPRQGATRKRALSAQQIRAIMQLPYKENAKGYKATCRHDLAKDCFILSFCLMGMNSVDLYNCTTINGNTIIYNRSKTKDRRDDGARMEVVVPDILQPLIEKYRDKTGSHVFLFHTLYSTPSSFNKAINLGLKEIGRLLSIDDLEFYAARHSWATIALNKCGIDKYTVHASLNHVDPSMRVTDIYIERDFVMENKANAKVIDYVFGETDT